MIRSLLVRTKCSRLVSVLFVVSLLMNIFLFQSSRHIYRSAYTPQTTTAYLYNEVTPSWNVSQNVEVQVLETKQLQVDNENLDNNVENASCNICPYDPPILLGPLADMTRDMTPEDLISTFPEIRDGRVHPQECVAREKLAILIPYRNRYPHLHVLLHNLIPFLIRQQADATIFVIEQAPPETFNRGALLNVGFLEAEKFGRFNCFIFHDVDLIPLDDRHLYRCGDNPKHFAVAMNKYKFRMPYKNYFGGIVGLSRRQFLTINGCSNVYFGWGGEDDDMKDRVINKGYSITRSSVAIARYDMIKHTRDKGNEINPVRKILLSSASKRQNIEGLNTIRYSVNSIETLPLYIWIKVSLNQTEILQKSPSYILEAMLQAKRVETTPNSKNNTLELSLNPNKVPFRVKANKKVSLAKTGLPEPEAGNNKTKPIIKEVKHKLNTTVNL